MGMGGARTFASSLKSSLVSDHFDAVSITQLSQHCQASKVLHVFIVWSTTTCGGMQSQVSAPSGDFLYPIAETLHDVCHYIHINL